MSKTILLITLLLICTSATSFLKDPEEILPNNFESKEEEDLGDYYQNGSWNVTIESDFDLETDLGTYSSKIIAQDDGEYLVSGTYERYHEIDYLDEFNNWIEYDSFEEDGTYSHHIKLEPDQIIEKLPEELLMPKFVLLMKQQN